MTSAHVTPVANSCTAFWFACLSASLTDVCVWVPFATADDDDDSWISYLHAITGGPMLVTAAEADAMEDAAAGAEEGEDAKAATTLVIFQKEGTLGMTFGSADPSGAPPVSISRINRTGLAAQQPVIHLADAVLASFLPSFLRSFLP
eukprot:COSAG06_NODE_21664_length_749_cov_1.561538_1_plen_146_part_10